jgi:hypothetical protein
MALYPSFIALVGSRQIDDDGLRVDRAESGKPRFQSFYSQTWRAFDVQHELDNTEKATLEAFYNANKYVTFTFRWDGDGVVYTCRFAGHPEFNPSQGGYWLARVPMLVTG